jgi:hypothetical protein
MNLLAPLALLLFASPTPPSDPKPGAPAWDFNATIIEACSCPMFCQCYFHAGPAGVGCCSKPDDPLLKTRYCKFNNAFKVNKGSAGATKLDGAKFWVAGDLGADFSTGTMGWAVLHFDPSVTKEQRDAITTILGVVYPVKWDHFSVGPDAKMDWNATRDHAEAKLDGGRIAEVQPQEEPGMSDEPIVIKNLALGRAAERRLRSWRTRSRRTAPATRPTSSRARTGS